MVLTGGSSNSLWRLVNTLDPVPLAAPRTKSSPTGRAFRFSVAQRQAVIDAYAAGATMAALAAQYGVHRTTISELLKRERVSTRQKRRGITPTEVDEAVRLYESGLSLQRIADRLGRNHNTIYRHLKERGVVFRGPNDWQYS